MPVYSVYTNQRKFITFGPISVRISEHKIASYFKTEKDDCLLVHFAFVPRIRIEMFLNFPPEPGSYSPARLTTLWSTVTTAYVITYSHTHGRR